MNLYEIDQKQNNKKTKKIMIGLGATIAILSIISVVLFIVINYLQEKKFKFIVDTKTVSNYSADTFVFEENDVYVSIKDIAPIVGYKYYNGGYKQYSEDSNSCYVQGENEIATFENESNKIYKTPVEEVDYELFTITEPVKIINNKLYMSVEGVKIVFNIKFDYDKEANKINVYTLPYLVDSYTKGYEYAAISEKFNNQKALLYNLLVVQNIANNTEESYSKDQLRYGVITLNSQEIVGTKYTDIEFIESTKEFLVTTEEKKVGIITDNGETKVKPQFDALKQIDKDLNLYLATINKKKGILEKNGKILIYLEYDEIGIDTSKFESSSIKNPYVIYNNVIPVMQNNKWGLFDIKGNLIVPLEYDGIGCVFSSSYSSNNNANSTVLIPGVEGIVFAKEYTLEQGRKITLYGIVNSKGNLDVPAGLESVYFIVNNGREEYTMKAYQGETYNVIDYYNKYVYNKTNNKTN